MKNPDYKKDLKDAVIRTKAIYYDLLQQYSDDKTPVSDPDWEKKMDKINLARINWLTAKSRIEGLDKEAKVIEEHKTILIFY